MKVLVVFAHPVQESYAAYLLGAVQEGLGNTQHEIETIDLYADQFSPALSAQERRTYYDPAKRHDALVERYIGQVKSAEALVFVFPVWNYGFPAMLKGFFDRVFVTGVAFSIENGNFQPTLKHIRKAAVVTTYGGGRLRSAIMGDPPRLLCGRMLWSMLGTRAPPKYLALYGMDRDDKARRMRFADRIRQYFAAF
jgi:NAD(P)H dehydrogenase (quinone)